MALAYIFMGLGICLLLIGVALSGLPMPSWDTCAEALGAMSLTGLIAWWHQISKRWYRQRRTTSARRKPSDLAVQLIPQLYGEYTPYIIQAAEQLGDARDTTAVPDLLCVLETCVDAQRPGWCEVAEALANALAHIGDSRALPILYRLENVRGIGFIPAIRNAIAVIEPQASLLRPNMDISPEMLLRPVQGRSRDEEQAILLRPTDAKIKG